jgi:hypothetical protein
MLLRDPSGAIRVGRMRAAAALNVAGYDGCGRLADFAGDVYN